MLSTSIEATFGPKRLDANSYTVSSFLSLFAVQISRTKAENSINDNLGSRNILVGLEGSWIIWLLHHKYLFVDAELVPRASDSNPKSSINRSVVRPFPDGRNPRGPLSNVNPSFRICVCVKTPVRFIFEKKKWEGDVPFPTILQIVMRIQLGLFEHFCLLFLESMPLSIHWFHRPKLQCVFLYFAFFLKCSTIMKLWGVLLGLGARKKLAHLKKVYMPKTFSSLIRERKVEKFSCWQQQKEEKKKQQDTFYKNEYR